MDRWPALRLADWADTRDTLHLWTQVVGKVRLRREPMLNHWWNVTLYVTPRGLTTSAMPCEDGRFFRIDFDFIDHALLVDSGDRGTRRIALEPMTVAAFYRRVMDALASLGVDTPIYTMPSEIPGAVRFEDDTVHAAYEPVAVERFFAALREADRLCKRFRSPFIGKASPTHFFWGSFDLAVTRFSGRRAPPHPGGIPNLPDWATREAYSHEEHSAGFWPGGYGSEAIFYAYAYPEPPGFSRTAVTPSGAAWSTALKEFVLPYDAVRESANRDAAVLGFFQSTYDAAATLSNWDRASLERPAGTSHDSKSKL